MFYIRTSVTVTCSCGFKLQPIYFPPHVEQIMHLVIPTVEFDDNEDEFSNYISEDLVVLWVLYFLVIIYCHSKY